MIFARVRLPDQIRIALEEDRLVIFAGAGVSMPSPSNLPSFNALASQIGGGVAVLPGKEDQFLGKRARNGTDVHAVAAKTLYHQGTKPTELHRHALRIFAAPDKVRIVTTNFDDHFSGASHNVFGKAKVREFYAPALPLGDDFHGIVYLHGSARENPKGMVLTDKDFGAAYLTRGWARDFLISLFSHYTVLFVGYSHNDVTTTYLARGLNQSQLKPRWALVSSDLKPEAEEHWIHLEISVQQYPIDPANPSNTHQALTDFFVNWAKHTKESLLHRARKLKTIARALPPESDTVSEYLDYCLRNPRLAEDFCNGIRHPAWIGWMNAKGYFKPFFGDPKRDLNDHERAIAWWLSTFVRREHPELLLEIIEEQHQQLARGFTEVLGQAVWTGEKKERDRSFSTWVSLLLSQGEQALSQEMWAYLLQECQLPEHTSVALRLFELLTTPKIRLRKHLDFSAVVEDVTGKKPKRRGAKKVDYEVVWPEASRHWLEQAWKNVFKKNLPLVADSLMLLSTKQLVLAHVSLRGVDKGGAYVDRLSWQRSSIAAHEQNRNPLHECLFLLVDVARDVLIYWFGTNSPRARLQIELWWSSDFPLLRRLAAYGIASDPTLSADERLEWLLSKNLVFQLGMKKEVFDILEVAYPKATQTTRKQLLRRIAKGFEGTVRRKLGQETAAYEQFNVLVWLRKSDPKCSLVAEAIARLQKQYPSFGEREHPAFDHWHGKVGFVDPKEGFDIERIVAEPPSHFLQSLLGASENSMRKDRWDHLSVLPVLFAKNREWGKGFTQAAAANESIDKEIWNGIFGAWKETIKKNEDWIWILTTAEELPQVPQVFAGLASLISNLFQSEGRPEKLVIDKAAALMDVAWNVCSKIEEPPDNSYREWLTSAINHEGGWIGEFWVHYCSQLRQQAGTEWSGIPPNLKSKMKRAIQGNSRIKVYARIALTPWMGYIFAWDKQFAIEQFLPLLDWDRDPVVAQQTWSVLLNYRRAAFIEMEQHLLPYYKQFAERLKGTLRDTTERTDQFDRDAIQNLGGFLAGLAMRVIENPVETGFFRDFLPPLPEKVRGSLSRGMGDFLEGAPPEQGIGIWNRWLRQYLDLRLTGVPVALSDEETKAMAEWAIFLAGVFPEVVQRLTQMRLRGVFAHGIIDKLLKQTVIESFPKESCRYVSAILRAEDHPFLGDQHFQLHARLKKAISGTPELNEFEEILYLRGWKK